MSSPLRTDRFDRDFLPVGVSKLLIEVGRDGLSRPLEMPVLVARGTRPGPTLGLTAALHGNELNGIPVIHRIFKQIDVEQLKGTIAAVIVVNVPGYLNRQRRHLEGDDLNHVFPGRADGRPAQVHAHRLLEQVVQHFDTLIDLHTASFGRVNSLYIRADMTEPETAQMAYRMRPQIIVHNPPSDGTLRGAAADLGIRALTLEIGNPHRFHRDYIRASVLGIRTVLAAHGMIRKRPLAPGEPPVVCKRSHWQYTDAGGLLEVLPSVTDSVAQGEVIATLTDPFGEVIREYEASTDGVVVGRSVDPVAHTGSRILHLGEIAPEGMFVPREEPR